MRWLIHGAVTSAAADALRRHGHQAQSLEDAKADATDLLALLKHAHKLQLDVITTDVAIIVAVFESGLAFGRSIVFLQLSGGDVEQDDAIDRLFKRYKRLAPGRLYTVTETRVKIRQLPGAH